MVKPIHSLSSVQPESYRGIILFLFDNIKIISIREQDLSLIGRNPEWRFEIPNLQRSRAHSHYSSSSGRDRTGKSIQSKGIDSEQKATHTNLCLLACFFSQNTVKTGAVGLEKLCLARDLLLGECFFFCRYLQSTVLFFN